MTVTYTCDNTFGFKEELYTNVATIIGQNERFLDLTICDRQGHSVVLVEKVGKLFIQEREAGPTKQILIKTAKGTIILWKNNGKAYVTVKYTDKEIYPTLITFRYRYLFSFFFNFSKKCSLDGLHQNKIRWTELK